MTDNQLASLSWCRGPIWSPWLDYNCFWALPEQSLWGPSPAELRPYFTVSFETPSTCRARPLYLYRTGTKWPCLHPWALGSLFVAPFDWQWRYSNLPPHGWNTMNCWLLGSRLVMQYPLLFNNGIVDTIYLNKTHY
jgi:hypothetical protein